MSNLTLDIPQIGALNSSEDPKIATSLTTIQTWAGGQIDGANLDPSVLGRPALLFQASAFIPAGTTAGSYLIATDGTLVSGATSKPIYWFRYTGSDFTVAGTSNPTMKLRGQLAVNAVAPTSTIALTMNAATIAGTGGQMTWTIGSSQLTTVSFVAPSASSVAGTNGSVVGNPVSGVYAPVITISVATTAANSACCLTAQVFLGNT